MSEDRDLRERFQALRSEDRERAEPAPRVLARARARADHEATRSSGARPWRSWAPAAAAAVLVLALWGTSPWTMFDEEPNAGAGSDEAALTDDEIRALGSLHTPSDVLLELDHPNLLGARPPELLHLPELQIPTVAPSPVRESALIIRSTVS